MKVFVPGTRSLRSFKLKELKDFQQEFIRQTEMSINKKSSSLAWFDSLISPWKENLLLKTPVAVVEFGGSFLRLGVCRCIDGKKTIWLKAITKERVVNEHINPQALTDWLSSKTVKLLKKYRVKRIGLIFSYPHQPKKHGRHVTGVVSRLTKALSVPGLVGTDVGRLYLNSLKKSGVEIEKLVMLNDTVALALCEQDALMGLVMGTGANICGVHPKLKHLRNIEAGNFDGVKHVTASLVLDLLNQPGQQIMEKQSTGLYQYKILSLAVALTGMRTKLAQAIILAGLKVESLVVSEAARDNFNLLDSVKVTAREKKKLKEMAVTILENSWQMWGAALAGVMKMNQDSLTDKPVKIAVTGGVILNDLNYFKGLKETVKSLSGKKVQLIKVKDPIRGAAVAALKAE